MKNLENRTAVQKLFEASQHRLKNRNTKEHENSSKFIYDTQRGQALLTHGHENEISFLRLLVGLLWQRLQR